MDVQSGRDASDLADILPGETSEDNENAITAGEDNTDNTANAASETDTAQADSTSDEG